MRSLFVILLLFSGWTVHGQVARTLSAADGLSENTGQALAQDSLGFIWIGTQNGLARYDGANFECTAKAPTD